MNDGPQGFRDDTHVGTTTAFPSGLSIGATWDRELAYSWGEAMGKEFYGKGSNVQLGPGLNVAVRVSPLFYIFIFIAHFIIVLYTESSFKWSKL